MTQLQETSPRAGASGGVAAPSDFYDYQIVNSVRFDGSTSQLTKTWGSAGTNDDKFAISVWVKGYKTDGTWGVIATSAGGDLITLWATGDRDDTDTHNIGYYTDNGGQNAQSLAKGRDVSAWRHIVMIYDSTESAGADRLKFYNNGEHWTTASATYWENIDNNGYPDLNKDAGWGKNGDANIIGKYTVGSLGYYYGYMADFVSIDGAAAISDFGESKNGVWIPKDPSGLTFGNSGFWLKFTNASDFGEDFSGNNNDWTVSGLTAPDQLLDTPTFNDDTNGGNFCTFNPLNQGAYIAISVGNLKTAGASGADAGRTTGTMAPTGGKWYWECVLNGVNQWIPSTGVRDLNGGAAQTDANQGPERSVTLDPAPPSGVYLYATAANNANMGTVTLTQTGITDYASGDVMSIALDLDNRKMWYAKNGTWFNSGDPVAGTDPQVSWSADDGIMMAPWSAQYSSSNSIFNFGQEGTFNGTKTAGGNTDDTGYGNFLYDVPDAFLAMCSGNLSTPAADPADDDGPGKYCNAVIYTGTGSSQGITGVGFQPDAVLIKNREEEDNWLHQNATLGVGETQAWNSDAAVVVETDCIDSFDSDGFTVDSDHKVNASSETYASYSWKESADAGFDIYTYDGTGSAVTVAHNLGVVPDLILNFLNTGSAWDSTSYWNTPNMGTGYGLFQSLGNAAQASTYVDSTTTSDFVTTNMSTSGRAYFGYAIAKKEGLVHVGQYEGNGNVDGAFVYCGFMPKFVLVKATTQSESWQIFDSARDPYNVVEKSLQPDNEYTEGSGSTRYVDFLSNGFKWRSTWEGTNRNGYPYVFLAMAHNPFKYTTAR